MCDVCDYLSYCSVLDNPATGGCGLRVSGIPGSEVEEGDNPTAGGVASGHGMVLALHLMKLLKSSRKFTDLMTRHYDPLKGINCLRPIHMQLQVSTCTCEGCVHMRVWCVRTYVHTYIHTYMYTCIHGLTYIIVPCAGFHTGVGAPRDFPPPPQLEFPPPRNCH